MKYQAHIFDEYGYLKSSTLLNSTLEAMNWLSLFKDIPHIDEDIEIISEESIDSHIEFMPIL